MMAVLEAARNHSGVRMNILRETRKFFARYNVYNAIDQSGDYAETCCFPERRNVAIRHQ